MPSLFSSPGGFLRSSIGRKWIVAVTGLILVGFVAGHLVGNLLVFAGPDALNEYAVFLHQFLHGGAIWIARLVLLASVGAHIYFTILLTRENRAARQQRYAVEVTQNASSGSRWMIWSGLLVLAFIIFHLLHYTVRIGAGFRELPLDSEGRFDVYRMLILGFSNPLVSLFYAIAIAMLSWHLSHGVSSMFQTLGITTPQTRQLFDRIAIAFSALLFVGYVSIPLSVLLGWIS